MRLTVFTKSSLSIGFVIYSLAPNEAAKFALSSWLIIITGISLSSVSSLHSLRIDHPSLPGISTSNNISFGFISLIKSIPFSPFVAPISVRLSFAIVLLIRPCIAASSSTRTTTFSVESRLITPSSISSLISGHSLGTAIEKTDPTPSSLDTLTSPPIISANLFDIGSPRPVPP